MGSPRVYEFDLSKITEFNHALIYGFDPEKSQKGYTEGTQPIDFLLHGVGQREDMHQAYYYAQETILKNIRIGHITPDDILTWLDGMHQRIAFTMAADRDMPELAGHATPFQITRWHQGEGVWILLKLQYLSEVGTTYEFGQHVVGSGFAAAIEAENVEEPLARRFIKMLHDYSKFDLPLSASQQAFLAKHEHSAEFPVLKAIAKLTRAYHDNLLTRDEREVVEALCKVCLEPEAIQTEMRAFATELAVAWNTCDKNILKAVSKLCRKAFFGVTGIHEYFNCNGRTGTCLANVISRSLGHKSFLMRFPGEKAKSTSSYAKAIISSDKKPQLLDDHIFSRISAADCGKGFADEDLKEKIEIEFQTARLCTTLKQEFPEEDIQSYWVNNVRDTISMMIKKCYQQGIDIDSSKTKYEKEALRSIRDLFSTRLTALRRQRAGLTASPAVQRQYSAEEQRAIKAKLELLTGLTGWKMYTKGGLQILLEINTAERGIELARALTNTGALSAQQTQIVATGKPVVSLQHIHPERLSEIQVLDGWVKPAATSSVGLASSPQ